MTAGCCVNPGAEATMPNTRSQAATLVTPTSQPTGAWSERTIQMGRQQAIRESASWGDVETDHDPRGGWRCGLGAFDSTQRANSHSESERRLR